MNSSLAAYAAGVFDANGCVTVTTGNAILRVTVCATKEQMPYLKDVHTRYIGDCKILLTGITARQFLEYIEPYLVLKSVCVQEKIKTYYDRLQARVDYRVYVKDSVGQPCF